MSDLQYKDKWKDARNVQQCLYYTGWYTFNTVLST